jgi:hypothetical protein
MDKSEKQDKRLINEIMDTSFKRSTEKWIRFILGSLLILVAINAFGGGYYGMAGAKDVPVEWLKGSPFHNYFIPGLFLFAVIGGSALIAAIAVFSRHRLACKAAFACGIIILLWLAIQVAIIGYISWLQPTTAIAAIFILILSRLLLKYEY